VCVCVCVCVFVCVCLCVCVCVCGQKQFQETVPVAYQPLVPGLKIVDEFEYDCCILVITYTKKNQQLVNILHVKVRLPFI